MKKGILRIGFIFLFCLICINLDVYGADVSFNLDNDVSGFSIETTNILSYYSEQLSKSSEDGYTTITTQGFVPEYTLTGKYQEREHITSEMGENGEPVEVDYWCIDESGKVNEKGPISEITLENIENWMSVYSNEPLKLTFFLNDKTYSISFHTKSFLSAVGVHYSSASDILAYSNDGTDSDKLLSTTYIERKEALAKISEATITGIIAGSVGAGFNVGVPYSLKQRPLTDLMEFNGNGYDFKEISSLKFTLEYYYSPLFGKMYATSEGEVLKIPVTKEDWLQYGIEHSSEFIKDFKVVLNPEFANYAITLSEDIVNVNGEKITDKTIENGVKSLGIKGSTNPKSVLSYNVQMVVPQLWRIENQKGQLFQKGVKLIENFVYCLFNEKIYTEDTEGNLVSVATMSELCDRNHIFLFFKQLTDEDGNVRNIGTVLIGSYSECVVDTTQNSEERNIVLTSLENAQLGSNLDYENLTKNLYLTGRKVYFDNGYSDYLNFENANVDLMYVIGEGEKISYNPSNVSFPIPGAEIPNFYLYDAVGAQFAADHPDVVAVIDKAVETKDDLWMFKYMNNKDPDDSGVINLHGAIPKTCKAVRMLINFGPVSTTQITKVNGGEDSQIENSTEETNSLKYVFYIVRNNNYIQDESLISWLKTDKAKSLPYVKANKLLNLILGNFENQLSPLSYKDWKQMQEIKKELQYNKDRWIISAFNILSIIIGTFLIILSILLLLFYWIDIFNTFTDFSFVQFISFGNLYPIENEDLIGYTQSGNERTKYVTFRKLLLISLIMMGVGLLFINIEFFVSLLVFLYDYILSIFGVIKR